MLLLIDMVPHFLDTIVAHVDDMIISMISLKDSSAP